MFSSVVCVFGNIVSDEDGTTWFGGVFEYHRTCVIASELVEFKLVGVVLGVVFAVSVQDVTNGWQPGRSSPHGSVVSSDVSGFSFVKASKLPHFGDVSVRFSFGSTQDCAGIVVLHCKTLHWGDCEQSAGFQVAV